MKKHLLSLTLLFSLSLNATTAISGQVGPYYATPSWDQTLPNPTRFVVLSNFNNQAFLDRNTGLVWQIPDNHITLSTPNSVAVSCLESDVGNQYAWRLPSITELQTLFERSPAGGRIFNPWLGILTTYTDQISIMSSSPIVGITLPGFNYGLIQKNINSSEWRLASFKQDIEIPVITLCVRGGTYP